MQRIKKGDTVEIIAGKDKTFRGEVLEVQTKYNKVVVEGMNIAKKHQQARQGAGGQQVPAQILDFPAPLDASNVMLVCESCDQKTRVGFRLNEDDMKVRYCKKCDADIDNP
ncbi:MAG: 50S ribosomal protein L24 [Chloroflexota bacterium]